MPHPELVPQKRTDKRGVAVTRWVRPGRAAPGAGRSIPAPTARATREPFQPGPNETTPTTHIFEVAEGSGSMKVAPPSPELLAIPRPQSEQLGRLPRTGYLFTASYAEFYDVLSAVPPQDALDLLQRGVRTAQEAAEFLDQHGIEHLGWDAGALTEECMRRSLPPNKVLADMGSVVGEDPIGAVSYIIARGQSAAVDEIRDYLLSGRVTPDDLDEVGLEGAAAMGIRKVADAIIRAKADGRDEFTLAGIRTIVRDYWKAEADRDYYGVSDEVHIEVALSVLRFHGLKAAQELGETSAYVRARSFLGEELSDADDRRLAGIAIFADGLWEMLTSDDDADAAIAAFDAGVSVKEANDWLERTDPQQPVARRLDALTQGLHSPTADGWL